MTYVPSLLQRWSPADPAIGTTDNYLGPDLRDFYVGPVSRSRDSGALEESNYRVVLGHLEQVTQGRAIDDEPTLQEHRFGHWGCGWYDLVLIHSADATTLQAADVWASRLDDYAVASETDLAVREWERAQEYWRVLSVAARIWHCRDHVSIFAARREDVPEELISELGDE